jgi:hypothetical protein
MRIAYCADVTPCSNVGGLRTVSCSRANRKLCAGPNSQPRGPEVGFEEVWTSGPPEFRDVVTGVFTPVLAKHSKSFSLIDCISVGFDRMQAQLRADANTGRSLAEVN